MAVKHITPKGHKARASYVHVFTPQVPRDGGEAKYTMVAIIPKDDTKQLEGIKKAIEQAKEEGKSLWGGKIPKNLRTPLRDGDEDRPDQPEFEGCWFINLRSSQKPGIVDRKRVPITDEDEFYSGAYCRVSMSFFPYEFQGNKGIGAGLNNIQKVEDGEPLGGRTRPEDDFDALDDDTDGDFGDDDLGL